MLYRSLFMLFSVFLMVMYLLTGYIFYLIILMINMLFFALGMYVKKNPQSRWVKKLFEYNYSAKKSTMDISKQKLYRNALQFFISSTFLFLIFFMLVNRITNQTDLSKLFLAMVFIVMILFLLTLCSGLYLLIKSLVQKDIYIPFEEDEDEEDEPVRRDNTENK